MPLKLNQMLALRQKHQATAHDVVTNIHHIYQKTGLFTGHTKVYKADDDASGEMRPPESSKIQMEADTLLIEVKKELTKLFDSTATVEYANCHAKADVVLPDGIIFPAIPVTYLLFLEKQLNDLHTLVVKMPILDPAYTWTKDVNRGCYVTEPELTNSSKQVTVPLVLYPATKEHPAQATTTTEQVHVGKYYLTKFSAALPADRKKELTDRVVMLQEAVKVAREEANTAVVTKQEVGEKILGWLFAP